MEALRVFRERAEQAARQQSDATTAVPLVDTACRTVEAILTGVYDHLERLRTGTEVVVTKTGASISLQVRLPASSSVEGEIATRSRILGYLYIQSAVKFTLQQLPSDPTAQPVSLHVEGLDMPAVPECDEVRRAMKAELGADPTRVEVYDWWERNKLVRWPPQVSKFYRVVESMLEQRAVRSQGKKMLAYTFWGYLHTTGCTLETFEYHAAGRGKKGITMTARVKSPTPEEEAIEDILAQITIQSLREQRGIASRVCKSAINWGALKYAQKIGVTGADPNVVIKLLSPVRWWGPGKQGDGWHIHDDTWQCVDRTDMIGRVIKENGRILWHVQGSLSKRPSVHSAPDSVAGLAGQCPIEPADEGFEKFLWLSIVLVLLLVVSLLRYAAR